MLRLCKRAIGELVAALRSIDLGIATPDPLTPRATPAWYQLYNRTPLAAAGLLPQWSAPAFLLTPAGQHRVT
jgi:hypothetical protein